MHLRKLTRKSFMGFGLNKNQTVQRLIDRHKHLELIAAYYKLSHIDFFDDVLDELKITIEWRIPKPGTDRSKHFEFTHKFYKKECEAISSRLHGLQYSMGLDKIHAISKASKNKGKQQWKNQGH